MFTGNVVVITGAGRGLGLGIARRFGEEGAHVVIAELDPVSGAEAAATLRNEGISSGFEPLDVRQPEQSLAMVERIVEQYWTYRCLGQQCWYCSQSTCRDNFHPGLG